MKKGLGRRKKNEDRRRKGRMRVEGVEDAGEEDEEAEGDAPVTGYNSPHPTL